MAALFAVFAGQLGVGFKCRAVLPWRQTCTLLDKLQEGGGGDVADALQLEILTGPGLPEQDPKGAHLFLFGDILGGLHAHGPFDSNLAAEQYGANLPRELQDITFSIVKVEAV
jgi:hypothetical protein